jgi:vitamin B12 transporter
VKLSSSNNFTNDWSSKLTVGTARDKLVYHGSFEGFFETRQDQASWIHEVRTGAGSIVAGYEEVHQQVKPATITDETGAEFTEFSRDKRRIRSLFASYNESWQNNRIEANVRRDDIQDLGAHNTGSVSYGYTWSPLLRFSVTGGRGFRAPTFNDLYAPAVFGGNPALKPERSQSKEITLAGQLAPFDWRLTGFDNRFDDLILYDFDANQVINVASARVRGVEAAIESAWVGLKWRGSATFQRPRDEATGQRLPSRAEQYGSLDVSRDFARTWNAGIHVTASGPRFDSPDEEPATKLPGYAVIDARLRYRYQPHVTVELTATNLADRHYQGALGYDAPGRGVMLNVRFDAF